MNKYNGYIAILLLFFVFFLGIRIPGQNHRLGPKNKSRAVITQTTNKNLSLSFHTSDKDHDNTTPVATLPVTSYQGSTFAGTSSFAGNQTLPPQPYSSLCSSRAPPTLS